MCHHSACSHVFGNLSRRELLVAAAGTNLVGGLLLRAATAAEAATSLRDEAASEWPLVRVAYLRPKEKYWLGWPGTAWNVDAYVTDSRKRIEGFAAELKLRVAFEPEPLYDAAAVDAFIAKTQAEKPAAVLLMPLHMDRWAMVDKIAQAGLQTIIFAPLGTCFTGHLAPSSKLPKVYLASSGDFELKPIRFGLNMVRTAHEISRMRIAVIAGDQSKDEVLEPLGLAIRRIPRQRFVDVLQGIGETPDVLAMAQEYRKSAQKVVEPSKQDLINASRNYFTALRIIEEAKCDGVTMDCLGAVFDRDIQSPPCLAWSRLLDAGIPAICEADTNAIMSNTLCLKLLNKPGFMQDPVPETVNNTLIGAHCVCATRLNGLNQPPEPFCLRSHSESDVGVSVQVIWKPEQPVTVMQIVGPDKMILGKGKVLKNYETPPAGGCRTSVELAIDGPVDVRETKGFHQLFIYGDHVRDFEAYAQMYGIKTEHI